MLTVFAPKHVLKSKKETFIASDDVCLLNFESNDNGIKQFYQLLDSLKRTWNINDAVFVNMHTALSEAAINAVEYGNKRDEKKSVYIHGRKFEEEFTFTIEDEGVGFNYHRIENPTGKQNREKPGGRGIFIMTYLADTIHFSEGGTCVKMLFRNK